MPDQDQQNLFRLMTWLSPAYPVGAFTYSQGLESAIHLARVQNAKDVEDWIAASLENGVLWSDAVIFALAHAAVSDRSGGRLCEINAFALAFQPSAELRRETLDQGSAFAKTTATAWPHRSQKLLDPIPPGQLTYPVAVACAVAGHAISRPPGLTAWLHAQVANLISAAIRLVPLGQTQGQLLLASLEPVIAGIAEKALAVPLEDLSTFCLAAEICSMKHETQYSRLFRS